MWQESAIIRKHHSKFILSAIAIFGNIHRKRLQFVVERGTTGTLSYANKLIEELNLGASSFRNTHSQIAIRELPANLLAQ